MSIATGLRLLFPSKQYQVQQTNVLDQKDVFVQVCIEKLCSQYTGLSSFAGRHENRRIGVLLTHKAIMMINLGAIPNYLPAGIFLASSTVVSPGETLRPS